MAASNKTGMITVAENFDGVNTQILSFGASTNMFDKQGRLLETISASYDSRDGRLTSISTNTPSYDKRGDLISEILDVDADANGTVDSRSVSLYTHLSANSYYVLISFDHGADGHTDGIISATYTYDDNGHPLGVLAEMDSDADGVVDVHSIGLWTYHFDEHQATYVLQNDLAQPGVLQMVLRATYTLNDDGFPVSGLLFLTNFQVGEVQGTAAFAYDKFGNRVQYFREVAFPNGEGHRPYLALPPLGSTATEGNWPWCGRSMLTTAFSISGSER